MVLCWMLQGANTETVDYSGWTPLVWAVYENHPDVVEILVEVGECPRFYGLLNYPMLIVSSQ